MVAKRVFLSCVTNEFGSYRKLISDHLIESGAVEIEKQETFRASGEQTLIMLDDYIRSCDYVVHIVGNQTGGIPNAANRKPIIERYTYSQLHERLGLSKADIDGLSYTQWEAWLAVLHDRKILICTPEEHAVRDYSLRVEDSTGEQAAHMSRHLQMLRKTGRYADVSLKFSDHNSLTVGIMRALQPRLRTVDSNRVVPKEGLLQFDESAAGFYWKLLPPPHHEIGGQCIPDSVQHWKHFLESDAPTNSVGVLFGVSGSGKSSFFRAGVKPLLRYTSAGRIIDTIYLSASTRNYEKRILTAIKNHYPAIEIGDTENLVDCIDRYQESESSSKRKLIIILDQFEQWLQGWNKQEKGDLIEAVKRSRAEMIQFVLIVRDDFWTSVELFMEAIDQELTNSNKRILRLFDMDHAKNVLLLFGKAYGRIDDIPTAQQLEFVRLAVDGLANANSNEVVCLRLSLFAFMMRSKPWNLDTWKAVGGVEGLGVTFLKDTIGSGSELRFAKHRVGAKEVLRCLLPSREDEVNAQDGKEIRSQIVSSELIRRSGYEESPREFEELISVLHNELRLITQSDGESTLGNPSPEIRADGEQIYQLAHDFLIPAIREWLSLTQRSTPSGRAMLLLDARSTTWHLDNKRSAALPTIREYFIIRYRTKKHAWTAKQRELMKAAKNVIVRKMSIAFAATCLLCIGASIGIHYLRVKDAKATVDLLVRTALPQIDERIRQVTSYPLLAPGLLKQEIDATNSEKSTKAKLALLHLTGEFKEDLRKLQYSADSNFETVDAIRRSLKLAGDSEDPQIEQLAESERNPAAFCRLLVAAGEGTQTRIVERDPERCARLLVSIPAMDIGFLGDRYLTKSTIDKLRNEFVRLYQDEASGRETTAYILSSLGDTPKDNAFRVCQVLAADSRKLFDFTMKVLNANERTKGILQEYASDRAKLRDFTRRGADRDETTSRIKRLWETAGFEYSYASANSDRFDAMGVVALARIGEYEALWNLLNDSRSQGARSFAIKFASELGVDFESLANRLRSEVTKPANELREFEVAGLLLALGSRNENNHREQEIFRQIVSSVFESNMSSYIISSAQWVDSKLGFNLKKSNEKPQDPNSSLVFGDHYTNSVNQRFALVDFENIRLKNLISLGRNNTAYRKIEVEKDWPRKPLWCAVHEVTVADWIAYSEAEGREFEWPIDLRQRRLYEEGKSADRINKFYPTEFRFCPMGGLRRCDVLRYCNWLSTREGLEPFYVLTEEAGVVKDFQLSYSNGYRAPFGYEWEFASRAGCDSSWFFGNSEELMKQYVRCDQPTDTGLFADVGSLMPNTLGIFDSLGNAMEWVHELSASKQEGDLSGMFVRGGAYLIHPPNIDHSTAKSRKVESTSAEIGDWVDGLRLARWRD